MSRPSPLAAPTWIGVFATGALAPSRHSRPGVFRRGGDAQLAPARDAGCSLGLKPPEAVSSAPWRIARALLDTALPQKTVSVISGKPSDISQTLTTASEIQKIALARLSCVGRLLARRPQLSATLRGSPERAIQGERA
ncbi:aldehyde dehydrogenase family protein [Achromobacter xylosoxidans]